MDRVSAKRKPVTTPESLIDAAGKPVFGTFSEPFRRFDLLDFQAKTRLRRFINKLRLTEWQAVEVISAKGAFITAVYRFGVLDINLTAFFEKNTGKLRVWNHMDVFLGRSHPAKTLFDGRTSLYVAKKAKTVITNNYEINSAVCQGFSHSKKTGSIEFDIGLKKLSQPSIVSLPIKQKYPVYTEKDIFEVTGSIRIDGIEMIDKHTAMAIIDDHRGYYPRKSGYDWLTCFGKKIKDDKLEPYGLNLTDFRLNPKQYDFNENGFWNQDSFTALPLARFSKNGKIKAIKDAYGDIDLAYETLAEHKVSFNLLLFRIDYRLSFGKLNGYINIDGFQKYEFIDELGLSEYRYTII